MLAFDTCMGAMLEVGYQLAPFVHYLVGNQSCSLPDGFAYQGIMAALNQVDNDPEQVAIGMVRAFDAYYSAHDASGIYTHTALDLTQIDTVCAELDDFAALAIRLPNCRVLLDQVRDEAPRFCLFPMYTDVVEFCSILDELIGSGSGSDGAIAVHEAALSVQDAVHAMVVDRCGGSQTTGLAHGCAIYCPFKHIDSSYYKTVFARDCRWVSLLQEICDC